MTFHVCLLSTLVIPSSQHLSCSTYSAFMMKTMGVRDWEWGYSIIAWTINEFPWKKADLDVMQSPTAHAGCVSDNAHACHSYLVLLQSVRSGNIAKVIRFFNFKVMGLFLYSRSSWKSSTKWTRKSSSKLKTWYSKRYRSNRKQETA